MSRISEWWDRNGLRAAALAVFLLLLYLAFFAEQHYPSPASPPEVMIAPELIKYENWVLCQDGDSLKWVRPGDCQWLYIGRPCPCEEVDSNEAP